MCITHSLPCGRDSNIQGGTNGRTLDDIDTNTLVSSAHVPRLTRAASLSISPPAASFIPGVNSGALSPREYSMTVMARKMSGTDAHDNTVVGSDLWEDIPVTEAASNAAKRELANLGVRRRSGGVEKGKETGKENCSPKDDYPQVPAYIPGEKGVHYGQEHKVSNKTSATTEGVKRVIVSERHASTQSIVHKTTFVPPERLKTLPLRPDEVESGVQQLPEAAVVTPVPRSRTRVSTDAPVLARSASKDKDTRTATSATTTPAQIQSRALARSASMSSATSFGLVVPSSAESRYYHVPKTRTSSSTRARPPISPSGLINAGIINPRGRSASVSTTTSIVELRAQLDRYSIGRPAQAQARDRRNSNISPNYAGIGAGSTLIRRDSEVGAGSAFVWRESAAATSTYSRPSSNITSSPVSVPNAAPLLGSQWQRRERTVSVNSDASTESVVDGCGGRESKYAGLRRSTDTSSSTRHSTTQRTSKTQSTPASSPMMGYTSECSHGTSTAVATMSGEYEWTPTRSMTGTLVMSDGGPPNSDAHTSSRPEPNLEVVLQPPLRNGPHVTFDLNNRVSTNVVSRTPHSSTTNRQPLSRRLVVVWKRVSGVMRRFVRQRKSRLHTGSDSSGKGKGKLRDSPSSRRTRGEDDGSTGASSPSRTRKLPHHTSALKLAISKPRPLTVISEASSSTTIPPGFEIVDPNNPLIYPPKAASSSGSGSYSKGKVKRWSRGSRHSWGLPRRFGSGSKNGRLLSEEDNERFGLIRSPLNSEVGETDDAPTTPTPMTPGTPLPLHPMYVPDLGKGKGKGAMAYRGGYF